VCVWGAHMTLCVCVCVCVCVCGTYVSLCEKKSYSPEDQREKNVGVLPL